MKHGMNEDGDRLASWLVSVVPPGRFDRLALIRWRMGRVGASAS